MKWVWEDSNKWLLQSFSICKFFLQIILTSLAFSISAFQSPFFWHILTDWKGLLSRKRALSLNLQGKDPNKNHEDITQLNNTGKKHSPDTCGCFCSIFFLSLCGLETSCNPRLLQDSNNSEPSGWTQIASLSPGPGPAPQRLSSRLILKTTINLPHAGSESGGSSKCCCLFQVFFVDIHPAPQKKQQKKSSEISSSL